MTQVLEQTKFGFGEHDSAVFMNNKPWYSIGTCVKESMTVEDAIEKSGLNWEIELQDLTTSGGAEVVQKAVVRTDINKCLGVVSKNYKVLQNKDAFTWFQPFISNNLATFDAAGSLFNGRKVFILAKINREDMIIDDKNNDVVEKYILLSNFHDGTGAIRIGYTPIRVSCSNTLTVCFNNSKSNLIRVFHKGDVTNTLTMLQDTMNLIDQTFIATEEKYKELATKQVNSSDLQKYVKQVFSRQSLEELFNNETSIPDHEIKDVRKKLMNHVEEVFEMEYAQNAWTAYNAVNHYLNHARGKSVENTYNSLWFQSAKKLDQRALSLALNI